jgi:hypothetical protein
MNGVGKVTKALDLSSRDKPWNLEPLEGLGSSFSGSWFDAVRAMTDALLRDELKERREYCAVS